MSNSDMTSNVDETQESIVVTLQVLDEDGNPDSEATADLAQFLTESGFSPVFMSSADPSGSDTDDKDTTKS
jgi:hypothetical protein